MADPIDPGDDPTRAVGSQRRGLRWRIGIMKKLVRQAKKLRSLEDVVARANLTEAAHIELWMEELKRQGFTEFYAHPIREGPRAGELPLGTKAYGSDDFGKILKKAYATGGGPDLVAVGRKKILVGDIAPGEWSETTMAYRSGQPQRLPTTDFDPKVDRRVVDVHHLDKTKRDAERLYAVLPDEYMDHKVQFQDRYHGSERKQSRRYRVRPKSGTRSSSGRPTDSQRGLRRSKPAPAGKPTFPKARVVKLGGRSAVSTAAAAFKAHSAAVGVKAWRATRVIAGVALKLFVPLKALDVALEIALALWDRDREREERKKREKQRTLAEVFSQKEERVAELIASKVVSDAPWQRHIDQWDSVRREPGFLYARVTALVEVETYSHRFTDIELEDLSTYKVIDVDVIPTRLLFDFELEAVGEPQVVEPTEQDVKRLISRNYIYPHQLQKKIARRRLRYTIVPPLVTPFDILVTKINNLFLDTLLFVAQFEGILEESVVNSVRYNSKSSYDAGLKLRFPRPLNAEACRYCLTYLVWAGKIMAQHPLIQQDLQGNLENPVRGWQRRLGLLQALLEGRETAHGPVPPVPGRNFWYLADSMRHLLRVDAINLDPQIDIAVAELYEGATTICRDLKRVEGNLYQPESFYYGPRYKIPRF